ncbi:AbrB/MazE/SpoVT family DNA-binding domain-containing protein [Arthrobacter echini]|uniref:AbrB/MazE/SpoVT family DNA-binding domain-containing protein n=1 Tax=Arthrobacter echini TaxID=1529066 RepID=A0A4V3Z5I9_9MICC|nr:AbrB/MazE/SpoVT family DNA-binding domain-containing protein [Arthrobacter echini]THJ66819.1 AbrB/MazE/SpoVT family DNA-binding domain-containing protein [Arthrobacter echini]
MVQAKLTSKGQVTIPLEVRQALGLEAGSKIDFIRSADGRIVLEVVRTSVASLQGVLRRDGGDSLSVEAMNDAVQDEALARMARSDSEDHS